MKEADEIFFRKRNQICLQEECKRIEIIKMSTGEAALNIVLGVSTINVIAERDAANARLAEIKQLYPHLFLSDEDVNQSSGAFTFVFHVSWHISTEMCQDVVYNGRTPEGYYKWGAASTFTEMDIVANEFSAELDEDGNVALSEWQLAQITITSNECENNNDHLEYCLICGGYPEVIEIDPPDGAECLDCNGNTISIGDRVFVTPATNPEFEVKSIVYEGFENSEDAARFSEPGFLVSPHEEGYDRVHASECVKI